VKVLVTVPASVTARASVSVLVHIQSTHKLPDGRVVVRVDGKKARAKQVTGGKHRLSVAVTLRFSKGAHHVSATFHSQGRGGGHSPAVAVRARSHGSIPKNGCAAAPSACGFPDATNTGVPAGTSLTTYNRDVDITAAGSTFQNAVVHGTLNIDADNVTVRNVQVINDGEDWGISLQHTQNATIVDCDIAPSGSRLLVGIKDVYGDASGTTIEGCDISGTTTGIQTHEGLIADNYIHDMAYQTGDHLNGTTSNGSTDPLTIRHNTIFNQYEQTDAVSLFQDFGLEANRTITDNLLAGGGYTIYGGGGTFGTTHNIVITDNRISRIFFPRGGSYGPVAHFENSGPGNVWSGNVWDDTGNKITN
jgi:hypothetical protein